MSREIRAEVPELEIGAYAFNNNDLTHVSLPRDLEVIGTFAFAGNEEPTSIEFGESLREVHEFAFWKANPAEISLPQGIEHVGRNAFSHNQISTLILHEGVELRDQRAPKRVHEQRYHGDYHRLGRRDIRRDVVRRQRRLIPGVLPGRRPTGRDLE